MKIPCTNTARLLLVEDSEVTQIGLAAALQRIPFIELIGTAQDGAAAVEMVRELKPELILMDIGLPRMDGIAATSEIKKMLPHTKIIMFTSHDDVEDILAAFSSGADGYCLKDVGMGALSSVMRTVLDGAVGMGPTIAHKAFRSLGQLPLNKPDTTLERALTEREVQVLHLIVEGLSNKEIGAKLAVSQETIKTHVRHLLDKLCVSDRTQAVVKAVRDGLISL